MNIYQAQPGTTDENALTLLSLSTRGQLGLVPDGQRRRPDHQGAGADAQRPHAADGDQARQREQQIDSDQGLSR
jgi:hypothetical protein